MEGARTLQRGHEVLGEGTATDVDASDIARMLGLG